MAQWADYLVGFSFGAGVAVGLILAGVVRAARSRRRRTVI